MANVHRPLLLIAMILSIGCASRPLVPQGAALEHIATGFTFTEGPAFDGQGNIYFSDIPNQHIQRYHIPTDEVFVFRTESGRANGLMFDARGRLLICEGGNRRLTRTDIAAGTESILAERFDDARFNSPNDLVIDASGGIYFTDPRYGNRDDMEMDVEAVYYINPSGQVRRVIGDLVKPNGLILSQRGLKLYVADYGTRTIMVYDVIAPGNLINGRVFAEMDTSAPGGGDGMTIDQRGNVYCAGQGHIWVWDRRGREIARIPIPESPANVAFAGRGSDMLYITASRSLYRIQLNARGVR